MKYVIRFTASLIEATPILIKVYTSFLKPSTEDGNRSLVKFKKTQVENNRPYILPRSPHKYESLNVETTAYALMVHIAKQALIQKEIVEWLNANRLHEGGWSSTQDTVVTVEALIEYSTHSRLREVTDIDVVLESAGTGFEQRKRAQIVVKTRETHSHSNTAFGSTWKWKMSKITTASKPPPADEAPAPASTPAPAPTPALAPTPTESTANPPIALPKPLAVVSDFNGTVTPITLVKDTLMPYITNNIDKYLKENWGKKWLKRDINRIRKELATGNMGVDFKIKDKDSPAEEIQRSVSDYVKWYALQDRTVNKDLKKHVAVVKLLKHMWYEAYEGNLLQTPIFDDVQPAIKKWKEAGIKIYIFSSNEVEAQKQLFKQTDRGNLLELIDGYFDKKCGSKTSCDSYSKISQQLSIPPDKLVYISDSTTEAKAAMKVGMKVVLIHRQGNREVKEKERKGIPFVESFSEITFN